MSGPTHLECMAVQGRKDKKTMKAALVALTVVAPTTVVAPPAVEGPLASIV